MSTTDPESRQPPDLRALAELMEAFQQGSASMEEAYRRLEARIGDLDHELAVTNDYLSNLLEGMSDGVIAVDTAGRVVRFNRAAAVTLGYTADEVEGQSFEQIFGRPFAVGQREGTALRAKSGRQVPVSERDAPIDDRRGRRLGWVKVFQDLSELHALREQVRQIDRLAAIGEMAATVAHEIRNPLGGIKGFAAFLAQDTPESDPRRRLVDKIIEGARRLDLVVNELLEYTRPVDLRLRPVSCAAIVGAALAEVDCDRGRILIVSELDPAIRVLADADKLRQVLVNIVVNAVQSIGERGEISLRAEADAGEVTLICEDTGCGMPPEALAKVFSPFYTTKERGTGLGMAVALKIVEGHGGSIAVRSEAGQGTTFAIRLARAE
jgi:signal transduction histidine kinase